MSTKKVNIEAVCEAVREQKPGRYVDACARQYKNIIYVTPGAYNYDVEDIVGLSIRLTRRWNDISVTSPEVGEEFMRPKMIIAVNDLLPEFIIEEEEWAESETNEEHEGTKG